MLLHELGAVALLELLEAKKVSAVEVLAAIIERYDRVNPKVNAFATTLFDQARGAAERADQARRDGQAGPLCGLPLSIKDSQWLAGVPCMNGSKTMASFIPSGTCAAIERLQEAGAVIIGKTACPEFSYVGVTSSHVHGDTRNPWNLRRTSGGSSGGAAAAVGAGIGPLSLGGDGGGSIRIPAAFCGIVGFKPSFGVVPREPCFPTWKSLSVYGPMARNVDDARLMFDTIAGFHGFDRNSHHHHAPCDKLALLEELHGVKLMASPDLGHAPVDPDVALCFDGALKRLESAGATIELGHPGLKSSVQTWAFTAMADAWASDRHLFEHRWDELTPVTRAALEFGRGVDLPTYMHAQYARETIHKAYAAFFERSGARFLLTPTLGCPAFPLGRTWPARIGGKKIEPPWLDWAGFLYDANLAGFPTVALPMGFSKKGLPLSLQVIGRRGEDLDLLHVAGMVEAALDWVPRIPQHLDLPEVQPPGQLERPIAV